MAYDPTLDEVLNSLYGPEGGLTEEELAQYMPEPYEAPEYVPSEYTPFAPQESRIPQRRPISTSSGRVKTAVNQSLSPEARALLDTIAGDESPDYRTVYGGRKVNDLSWHPGIGVPIRSGPNAGKTSSAAGRYQFLGSTWNAQAKKLGLPDFSPESQDLAAWNLARETYGPSLEADLRSGDPTKIANVGRALRKVWTSLPGGIEQGAQASSFAKRFYTNLGAESGIPQQSYTQDQPQESPFDIVKLSDGSAVEVEKGTDLAAVAEILKKSGVQAEPIKNVALPNGSFVEAPYSYSDDQVFDIVRKSKPEIFGQQPEENEKQGYIPAIKSSFESGIGSVLTGLGGLGTYAGAKLESPIARQAGEYLTGKGKEWQKMGEEAYQELTPEEAKALGFEGQFRKYVGEPVAGFVGSMGAALPALALPGGAATRVGAFAAQELGGQLAEQERMGQAPDVEKALPYAVGSGIVQNSLLGPLKYVTKAFGKPDVLAKIADITKTQGAEAAKDYAGGVIKNVLKETGINTGEVVVSEVISRAAERAASGQPLDTPDALAEYEDIAIKSAPGGLLGIPGAFGVHAAKQGTIEEAQLAQAQEAQNIRIAEEQKAAEDAAAEQVQKQAEADAELERQAGIGVEGEVVPEPTIRGKEPVPPAEPVGVAAPPTPEISAEAVQETPEVKGELPPVEVTPEIKEEVKLPTHFSDTLGIASKSGKKTDIPLKKALEQLDIENPAHQPTITQALEEGIKLAEKGQIQLDVPKAQEIINFVKPVEVPRADIQPTSAKIDAGSIAQPEIRQEGQGAPVSSEGVRGGRQEIGAVKIPEIQKVETVEAPKLTAEQKYAAAREERIKQAELRKEQAFNMSFDDLQKLREDARTENERLDLTAIAKHFGKEQAEAYKKMNVFQRNRWWDKNATDALEDDSSVMKGIDESEIDEYINALSAAEGDNAKNLGYNVGLYLKNSNKPEWIHSPEHAAIKAAFDLADKKGWDRSEVIEGMRQRVVRYAGADAPELFERLFRVTPEIRKPSTEAPKLEIPKAPKIPQVETALPAVTQKAPEVPTAPEESKAPVSVEKPQTPAEAWESLRTPEQPAFESLSKNTQDLWKKEYKENEGIVSKDAVADYVKAEGIQSAKNIEIKEPTLYTWGKGAGHLFDEEALQRRNLARGAKPVETKGSMAPEYEAAFGKHLYESAQKYFAPGGGYEKGERYRVTAGKGGYRLFKTLDAAKDFAEQFGMKKGTRRVLDEYVPTKEELTTEQAAYVEPDKEKRLKLDAARYSDVKQGKELLQRYIEQGKDEKLKTLASLLAESPHAEAVKVSFVKQGDTLPNNVINGLRGANAIAVTGENGSHLYYRADSPDAFGEDILVHEAVHGLTTAAIRRSPHLNKALEDMSVNVGIGLSDAAARNPTPELKNIEEFWRGAVRRKPGEMLAYGLTSPTFKKILENYTADGKPIDLVKQDYARASISRQIPQPKTPKPLTLWQKFVDTIRRLFRIPEKNKEAFEQAVAKYHENVAAREEAIQKQITPKSLAAQLDEYLNQLLEVTKKEGIAMPTKETEISAAKKESTPLVKETEAESSLKRGMKEAVGAFKGNAWTRMETNYVNRHAALADAIKDKSTIDSNGKYRADLIGSANDQIFNVISAGITDGVPVLSKSGIIMIQKDAKKSINNITKSIDKLKVKDPRPYVGFIMRALRGEELKKEDAEAIKQIDILEEKAKKLKAHAKTLSFAEGKKADTLANRYLAEAKKLKDRVGEEGREKLVSDEDILEAKRRLAEHPEIQEILDNVHGLMNSLVDLWEASGLVSKDVANQWRSKPSYIPLYMAQEDILSDPSRVVRAMGGGAKSLPNVKTLKGGTHAINLLENLQKHYAFMTSAAAQNTYRKAAARDLELFGAARRTSPDTKNAIMFKDNGKEVYYEIDDPLMFEAFQAAAPLTNPLLKAAREYTKAFRAVTLVNPLYWYRQLIRDPIHANVVSKTGMVTPIGATISFAKIIAGASPEYKELRRRGVVGAVDSLTDPARFKKIYDKGPNLFKKGADWVMHVHEAADAATRVEVYKAAIKEAKKRGMNKEQAKDYATMQAREIINFAHQGRSETLQAIRATVPFFSAALNSLDSVARAATGKGLNRREAAEARRLFTSRMLMLASFTTAYALAMQDDEDYLKSPDAINNWLIPTGNKENPFIMIPLPFELGFVAKVLPELIVRMNSGTLTPYEAKKAAKEAAGATLTPPLPFPQVIKPAVEAAINYDLHQGRPIVSPSEARKMPEEQTRGASALSIEMGRQLGLSPAQIEHFGRGYLTELWTAIGVLSDAFLPAGQYKEAKNIAEIPTLLGGAKGVLSKPDRERDMDIFYELANGAQQIKSSVTAAQGKGDVDAMERIMADPENKKRFYASDVGREIGDKISEVNKAIEQVRNDKSIKDPKRKQAMIREYQQYKNTLATQGKEWFYSLGVTEP